MACGLELGTHLPGLHRATKAFKVKLALHIRLICSKPLFDLLLHELLALIERDSGLHFTLHEALELALLYKPRVVAVQHAPQSLQAHCRHLVEAQLQTLSNALLKLVVRHQTRAVDVDVLEQPAPASGSSAQDRLHLRVEEAAQRFDLITRW